jgi:hypothetical protein
MPASEISLLDPYERTLGKCCNDPLRPPRFLGTGLSTLLRSGNLAYTSVMDRLIVTSLGLSLFLPGLAVAQVRIAASAQHYGLQEEIHARV